MTVVKVCSRTNPHAPHEWIGRRGLRAECPGVSTDAGYARKPIPAASFTYGDPTMPDHDVQVDVTACARCDCNHSGLTFKPFQRIVGLGDQRLTHWAMCPMTGEPILLGQREPAKLVERVEWAETGL